MHMVRIKGNALGISPSDRIAGLSTFTFGSYYWNVFATVLSGATLHLYDFYRFPFENLKSWLIDRRITHFHCTPTTLRQFLAALDEPTVLADLRLVSLAGKPFIQTTSISFKKNFRKKRRSAPQARRSRPGFMAARFFRHRSRTESIKSPWGLSIRNAVSRCAMTRAANFRPVKRGEITVSSECLSPGYWKRAELNAAKYVVGEDQKRYFRSGDLGTFTPDGLLYQKGRSDFQVKIRGMRST